jgi:hypothetical protein
VEEKVTEEFCESNCIIKFILLKGALWLLHEERFEDFEQK